jgi:hypothetical protein
MAKQTAKDPFASIAIPITNQNIPEENKDPFASIAVPFKKKADTALSGKTSSTAGKFEVPDNDSAWYDWDNIKKAGTNLIDFGKGLGQEIPSETTRMVGDLISSFGLAVDLGGRYSSAGINYLMGDKKQAQKDIDSDPTFLGKYLVDAGNYLSESADQTKDDTLKNWGVSEKNRSPQRSFYDAFSDGDLGDGSAMLFRDVLATVPQVAAAVLSGGGSLEAQALRKSGGLLRQTALSEMGAIASTELPAVLSTGLKSQTGAQFKFGLGLGTSSSLAAEYKKDNHVTATDFLESIARGVVEGASESLFDTDILAAKKLASKFVNVSDNPAIKGIMASIVGEGEDAAKEKIVRTTTDILGKAFAGGRNEGFEEVASSFGNMLIDATKQGGFTMESLDKFKKDAIESFIVGSLSGGLISGGAARLSRVKLTDIQQKTIDRYNEVINDDSVSEEARGVAKERVRDILDFNASLSKDNYGLIAALPKEKRAEALGYLSSITKLEEDIKNTKDSEGGAFHEELGKDIKSYEDKVNKLIEDEYKTQREARRKETMSQSDIDTEDIINFFQSTEQQGFSIEDMDSALNDIRARVNNKEEIDQEDIGTANNMLYEIIDNIEKSELTAEQKKVASEPFFNQIQQLESYDKTVKTTEVTTPIQEVTTTTRETGRRERPKTTVLTDRFNLEPVEMTDSEGNKSNFIAKVNEDGSISLVPKVKFSRTAIEQKRKGIELDYNFLEFQESIKDENDRVIGARLLDKKTGNTIEISNPELAIDLATKAKQDALGNVSEGVMSQEKTVTPIGQLTSIVKEFVNKRAIKVAPQATTEIVEEEAPALVTETLTSPVGLPSRRAYVVEDDVETKKGNKILNKISPEIKKRIANYVKSLKATIPNSTVVLYENKADMIEGLFNQGYSRQEATKAVNESDGLYAGSSNTIHIDVMRMDKTTLPHEIFHPLVARLAKENPAEFIALRKRISKVLSESQLKELDAFAAQYSDEGKAVEAEEFLSQLGGLVTANKAKMERGTLMKLALAVKEFLKKIAAKTNSKVLKDFADSIFTEQTKTDDLIKFFEGFGKSLRQGEAINVEGLNSTVDLLGAEAYSESLSIEVPAESFKASKPIIKSKKIGKYSFPDGAVFESVELPIKSLDDIIKQYEGRVVIITSDATGYGVDSLGEPILGGFGFSTIKQNIDDNIGFASVGEKEVKSTMTRAFNIHGKGKAVVLIMIQPSFTTIGNSYGVKYFARGMREIAQKDATQLEQLKISMKEAILNSAEISEELQKVDAKKGKRNTEKALFKLIDSINKDTNIEEFTKEFLADTTFKSRTGIINMFLIDSQNVGSNVAAHPLKVALKEIGYTKVDFLNEYGDKSFLTKEMIESNAGGFVVGGFEIDIKSGKDMAEQISELQSKGIAHPLFNGKLGGTNHFALDGIYDVNENFAEFAKPESEITLPNEERDALVRDFYKEDKFYEAKYRETPLAERTYTQLKADYKSKFKDEVIKPTGALKYKTANVAASVARSLGFNLDEAKRDDLRKSEFKQRQKDTLRQKKLYPDAFEESRNEYLDKFKNTPKEVSRYLRKVLFERNINVKKAFEDAELEFSLYTMYNKAGASMFGNLKFTEKFNEIYGGLTAEDIKLLDNFILLRRTVAIDTNFDNREEPRPEHPDHKNIDGVKTASNKESALSMLEDYKDLLGDELYNKIYNSSDKYFKAFSDILKYKYENGLINKETYELYKDYNYSPRKFLQFMFGTSISEESKLTTNNFYQRGLALSKDELSKIQSGSTKGLFVDSAKLLHAAMIATEVRVASNLALKTLYNEAIPANLDFVKEVEYEKYKDGTIKVNPDGSLKYVKTADEGFRIVTFKEDGIVKAFQLKEDLAKEYFDEELFDKNSKAYKFAQIASGSNILRNMATGMNLAFFVTNIPVDALSQVQFSGIHDGASLGAPGQFASAIAGTLIKSGQLLPLEFGFKNKAIEDLIYEYGKAGGLMMTLTEEYSSKAKFLGNIPKYLGSFGNASEMGSKLNAYEKVRNNEIKNYKEQNGKEPIGEDLAKIQTKAAYIARAAMDYHRGGLLTKWIDGFIPYLNVLSQATKITADYIVKNPKDFTDKITQMGIFVIGLTIYNLMVAGGDYDNDDNEQDLLTKIVIFSPFKDADGKRGKLEIGAPDMVKKFLNIFQSIGEGIYYQAILGEKQKTDEWKIEKRAQYLSSFDLKLPSNIPPALKAMVEYKYNLDLWRNKDITKQLGDVLPQDEGRYNPSVASFYKIIGSSTGMSPIRLQKASENFITQSNPLVGIGYSLMDKMVNNYANLPESQRSKYDKGNISDIPLAAFDKIAGRLYSKTDPTVTYTKGKDIIDRINQTAGSKKQEAKAEMKLLVEKKASVTELNAFLIKQDPIYRKAAVEYRDMLQKKSKLNYPDFQEKYYDIMLGQNAEAKAQIVYTYFPYILNKGNEKLVQDLNELNLVGKDTKVYLNKYVNEKGIKE